MEWLNWLFALTLSNLSPWLTVSQPIKSSPSSSIINGCNNPSCLRSAQSIKESIDPTVSPCDDFYQFACGNWLKNHPIPPTKASFSSSTVTNDLIYEQMQKILSLNEIDNHESKSVRLAKFIYDQCLLIDPNDDQRLINNLFDTKINPLYDESKWYDIYLDNLHRGFVTNGLFEIDTLPHPVNISRIIISLDYFEDLIEPEFFLDDNDDDHQRWPKSKDQEDTSDYKIYLRNILQLIDVDSDTLVDEIFNIKVHLESFKMPEEDRDDLEKIVNVITYQEFKNQTGFDWLNKIINPTFKIFGVPLQKSTDHLLVSDTNYFKRLIKYLSTSLTSSLYQIYLKFEMIQELVPFLSEKYQDHLNDFIKIKAKYGIELKSNRFRTCFNQVEKLLPWAISRLYVDNYFNENDRSSAKELIDQVHKSFIDIIDQIDHQNQSKLVFWMADEDRKQSLIKLNHIRKNVAYPDWLKDSNQLDSYYNWNITLINKTKDDYLYIIKQFEWKQMEIFLSKVSFNQTEADLWPMESVKVNAVYSPQDNAITIPAGILNPPYFDSKLPLSMNLGAIGTVIGHELTHSLDDIGRHFDQNGNYQQKDWWIKNKTNKNFDQLSKCLIRQYSSIEEPTTRLTLNGRTTLNENVADNGGLIQAYHAFQAIKYLEPKKANQILFDLTEFKSEQLFFISYAQIWCTADRPETLEQRIQDDLHVLPKYRVNVPLSNFKDFSQTFQCPEGSRMNPSDKCIIW